ncbi:MAG TPA: hydantoinase/oxoprolinase family protein, partial [Cyclobacteriaceae bacterium]
MSWKIWVDTGGTFTDCLALDDAGDLSRLKVLSNGTLRGKVISQLSADQLAVEINWPVHKDIYKDYVLTDRRDSAIIESVDTSKGLIKLKKASKYRWVGKTIELTTNEEVPVFAARLLTSTTLGDKFPEIEMKLGSTRGTNAILERKGAKTALLITKGFKDLLVIGNQQRPDLFALHVIKEPPLYSIVIEVDEEINTDIIKKLKRNKIESVAVALINSYKDPAHEQQIKKSLQRAGFKFISASQELSKQIRILQRTETAVANAYLAPIIHNYVGYILRSLPNAKLKIMTSAGGLTEASEFHPKDSLLSGPAGGVVGAATTAKLSGIDKLITFDMGGTSTDVSLYDGRFDYRFESKVGSLKILSPSLAIETIAAGGGSICSFDGFRFTVGPESAGAYPGPACYGAGGPLTITDVNLLLGRIDAKTFTIPLSIEKAGQALNVLIKKVKKKYSRRDVLLAFVQIANEKMAGAIRKVSTQSGHDPGDYTLLSFGGAGGQHACALASMLGMKNILIPYDAGLLSAYGIGHAKVERFTEKLLLMPLEEAVDHFPDGDKVLAFVRFKGQDNSIEIDVKGTSDIKEAFRKKYEKIFGHWIDH